ncbi:hypothetical protein RJ639_028622 [Escallonia herrerae]|uniref:Uncharacterized protein n=1 Tax=Escallonia herrerae TaxID=1293975 RepID=A0AA88XHH8_9ASTE|nr:hypothetical protein RJ639_028622 [Escallonia herrerae]
MKIPQLKRPWMARRFVTKRFGSAKVGRSISATSPSRIISRPTTLKINKNNNESPEISSKRSQIYRRDEIRGAT